MNAYRDNAMKWCIENMGWTFTTLEGKKPLRPGWQSEPPLPPETLFYHQGNIGLRTGQASGGIVVVDLDPGADTTGMDLPKTVEVATGRGGKHLYYRCNSPLGNSSGKLGPHIDIRGDGGQVVFPGSVHPDTGKIYEFVRSPWTQTMAPLPAWIVERLVAPPSTLAQPAQIVQPAQPAAAPSRNNQDLTRICDAALHKALAEAAPGNSDEKGFQLALQLRDNAIPEEDALRFLTFYANRKSFDPANPFTERDVLRWWKSANTKPAREPWTLPPSVDDEELFRMTDLGNAERFKRQHGNQVIYDPASGWRVWDGQRWAPDASGEVNRLAHDTARRLFIEAAEEKDPDRASKKGLHAIRTQSKDRLKAIVDVACDLMTVDPKQFDTNAWVLNCLNGTIDLKTGELRPHRREDFITRLAPVVYDSTATHLVFDKVVAQAMPNPELRRYAQKLFGITLIGEQVDDLFVLMYGPGGTSKTTIIEPFKKLMGDYAATVEPESLMTTGRSSGGGARGDIARLNGVRLALRECETTP